MHKQKKNVIIVEFEYYSFLKKKYIESCFVRITGTYSYRRIRTYQEKRKWFQYEDEMKSSGLNVRRRKRSNVSLADSWDDHRIHTEDYRSWKKYSKAKRQWMKHFD